MFGWLKKKKQTNTYETTNNLKNVTVKDLKREADEFELDILNELEPYTRLLESQGYTLRHEQDVSSGKLYYYKELKLRMVLVDVAYDEIYIDVEPFPDDLLEEVFKHKDLDTVFHTIYQQNYLQGHSGYANDLQKLKKELQKIEQMDAVEYRNLNK